MKLLTYFFMIFILISGTLKFIYFVFICFIFIDFRFLHILCRINPKTKKRINDLWNGSETFLESSWKFSEMCPEVWGLADHSAVILPTNIKYFNAVNFHAVNQKLSTILQIKNIILTLPQKLLSCNAINYTIHTPNIIKNIYVRSNSV